MSRRDSFIQGLVKNAGWDKEWFEAHFMHFAPIADGTICEAKIHWFEAHGIGRKDFKIKRVIR